jgi:hypothetical protein
LFGGTCHLLNGNLLCGVHKNYLILRLGEAAAAQALHESLVAPFDITGHPMKGWVMVAEGNLQGDALERWLNMACAFVQTLPSK